MFTPKLNTPRAKGISPFTTGNRGRRSVGLFTPPPRSTPSSRAAVGRALQTSQIVEETAQHVLEVYGAALPVLITEALALADRSLQSSVQLDEHGWAWLVCGRRLFVWRYKQGHVARSAQCKELLLPPSDLSHSARLVTLVHYTDNQVACLAASPEGAVRYWPSVSHDGSYVEISTELRGEECATLITLQSFQCVLATTTSSLVILTPIQGQNQLSCRPCRMPQGVLSGVGRRMSSFLWGSGAPPIAESVLHQVVAGEEFEDGSCSFYVLTGTNLQKWMVHGSAEKFLYEFDVEKQVRENIAQAVWGQEISQIPDIKTWILDMQMARDGLVILAAGLNPDISPTVHYVMGTLHIAGMASPRSFLSFTVTRFTQSTQQVDESSVVGYSLLLPDPSISSVYLYNKKAVICLSVSTSDIPYDTVEFQSPGDKLLGAGKCDGVALFFSNNHGLVTLRQAVQKASNASMNESMAAQMTESFTRPESAFASMDVSRVEEMSLSEDKTAQLKAACVYHIKGNKMQADQILDELFPSGGPSANLDNLVADLSTDMIDAYPSPDPRWAEVAPGDGTSTSNSLILLHQLEDKLKAYELYISFLGSYHLMDRLRTTPVNGEEMATRVLLCQNAEKVFAAMTLRAHHQEHSKLVDKAIKKVLDLRGERVPATGLTHQDLFYRRISRLHEILYVLYSMEEEAISAGEHPRQLFTLIHTINSIFMGMLHDSWQYRQSKVGVYQGPSNNTDAEYVPWTASTGPKGMRTALKKQHALTLSQGLPLVQDDQERRQLFQQLLELTDLILEGHKSQVEAVRCAQGTTPYYNELLAMYETDRRELILPFLKHDQQERAASIAEKYCDFGILVQLCEESGNHDRLQRYMSQFQNRGFSDFVFQWYVKEGKRGKLLSSSLANHPLLGKFLQGTDNQFMSWMHDISVGDFNKAHETLTELAEVEEKSLAKKKTLLSLSKLTALASDHPPADPQMASKLEALNDALDLVLHQETLPQEVIQVLGLDPNNMHVMRPKELIEHYVSDYDHNANEYDFKKALDLMQYIDKADPQMDYDAILLHIWCQAILRDSWVDIAPDDPLENSKDTVFFKTVELAYTEGMDLREYLPAVENLLEAEQLESFRDNKNFQYLVRAGYEQIQRILA